MKVKIISSYRRYGKSHDKFPENELIGEIVDVKQDTLRKNGFLTISNGKYKETHIWSFNCIDFNKMINDIIYKI